MRSVIVTATNLTDMKHEVAKCIHKEMTFQGLDQLSPSHEFTKVAFQPVK